MCGYYHGHKDRWRTGISGSLSIRKVLILAFQVIIKATRVSEGRGGIEMVREG